MIDHPLLTEAYEAAKAEKKAVFVVFTGSWCGPCLRFHEGLDRPEVRKAFDRAFVEVRVTVYEMGERERLNSPGAAELRTMLEGKESGVPYFAAIRADGTVLTDSAMGMAGTNMGFPASAEEIAAWQRFLAKVPTIQPADQKVLGAAFG